MGASSASWLAAAAAAASILWTPLLTPTSLPTQPQRVVPGPATGVAFARVRLIVGLIRYSPGRSRSVRGCASCGGAGGVRSRTQAAAARRRHLLQLGGQRLERLFSVVSITWESGSGAAGLAARSLGH